MVFPTPQYFSGKNILVTESARLHSPAPTLNRYCCKDYKMPDAEVIIEKGTPIAISILAIHNDSEFFPNPKVFDPDRFLDQNQRQIMMNFGLGHHFCVGKPLAKMFVKAALAQIVLNYDIDVNYDLTGKYLEDVAISRHVTCAYKNKIWLEFRKLK